MTEVKHESCGMPIELHSAGLFMQLVKIFGLKTLVTGTRCRELYLSFLVVAEVIRRFGNHSAELSDDEKADVFNIASIIEMKAREKTAGFTDEDPYTPYAPGGKVH